MGISLELEINEHAATLKCASTLRDAENTGFVGFLLKVQDGTLLEQQVVLLFNSGYCTVTVTVTLTVL